jgi:hypothetical protein
MTREEHRKARARLDQERHLAKVKKEKAWLATNPHITAQQEREKEERRLNNETIRMLQSMKEVSHKKKKKPNNAFAALMDSDSEEECVKMGECKIERIIANPPFSSNEIPSTTAPKKFVWADECDE